MNALLVPRVYVAGHHGMVRGAIVCELSAQGWAPEQVVTRTPAEVAGGLADARRNALLKKNGYRVNVSVE